MTNARIVETFIEETLARTDTPGRLRKLTVCHVIKGNKLGDEIRAVSVPDAPDEEWRTATATKIAEQAAMEAIALSSGIQRYAILALFEGDDKPHGRSIITAEGKDDEDDALDTEGPDGEGLVTQSMAQTRFFASLVGRSTMQQVLSLERQVEKLTKENESMREERIKSIRVMESIYSAQHERGIENRREEAKAKALEGAADKLGLLLPVAINHIAGRKILPENAPERLILQSLAQRLTPEKLQLLAQSGAFDEAELVALLSILKAAAGPQPPAAAPPNGGAAPHTNGAAAP